MSEPREVNVPINSDIAITCPRCLAMFTGKAMYNKELIEMFNQHHPCFEIHIGMESDQSGPHSGLNDGSGNNKDTQPQ